MNPEETKQELTQKVSIIIPCRNSSSTIERCLNSISKQTYPHLEVICIDDKSSDDTIEIIEEHSQTFEEVELIRNRKWLGTMGSRIEGIERATGEYICFVDSDDYIEDNYVESLLGAIVKDDADIAFTEVLVIDKEGRILPVPFKGTIDGDQYRKMFVESGGEEIQWYVLWGKIYRSNLLKEELNTMCPYKDMQMCEDLIINSSIAKTVRFIASTKNSRYIYCINPKTGLTSSTTSYGKNCQYISDVCDALIFSKNSLGMALTEYNNWKDYFVKTWKDRIDKMPTNRLHKVLLRKKTYHRLKKASHTKMSYIKDKDCSRITNNKIDCPRHCWYKPKFKQ